MGRIIIFTVVLLVSYSGYSQDFVQEILLSNSDDEHKINGLINVTEDGEFGYIKVDSVIKTLFKDSNSHLSRQCLLRSKLSLINKDLPTAINEVRGIEVGALKTIEEQCEWYFISGRLAVLDKPDSAMYFLEKAYDLASSSKNIELKYRSLRYLGSESARNSDYISAIDFYEKARQIGVLTNDVSKLIDYEVSAGRIAKYLEDYERLVEINESLLKKYSIAQIGWKKKIIYNNLAVGYAASKAYINSIKYQIKTLEISDTGTVVYNITLLNLATCILDSYESEIVNSDNITFFLNEVKFNEIYLSSDQVLRSKNDLLNLVDELINVSKSFFDKGNFLAFKPYIHHALGRMLFLKGNYESAESSLLIAHDLSLKALDISLVKEVADILSKLYNIKGDYRSAYNWKEKSTQIGDSISLSKQQTKIGYLLAKKEYENESYLDSIKQVQLDEINKVELKEEEKIKTLVNVFIITAVLLIIVIIYLFYRRKKLKTEHEMLSLEQNLLRTQMNPHFIFNSLTTISGFVLKNKNDVSYNYISKFAKLMRLILDSSRKDFISLADEVLIVGNFLALHKLNSRTSLEYEINYDEELLDEELKIPPMLLQPFIENAIKYGFNEKTNSTRVIIDFVLKENVLICTVKDFGKGFEENNSIDSKTSHAIKITQERIVNIQRQTKKNISLEIYNQRSAETYLNTGVLVELKIEI